MQFCLPPNAIFYFDQGTWHSFILGECWSSFCHHFWLNILHIEHMFCYLLAYFLPYSSPFSSRYGHILNLCKLCFICIVSWFSCLISIICNDILMYEIVIAESWSSMNQRACIASILDMCRAYRAHCPTNHSNRRANHTLLLIDSWALKAWNSL